jgi:hypothetical protein
MELTLTDKEAQFLSDILHKIGGTGDSRLTLIYDLIDKLGREDTTTDDIEGTLTLKSIKPITSGEYWVTTLGEVVYISGTSSTRDHPCIVIARKPWCHNCVGVPVRRTPEQLFYKVNLNDIENYRDTK